MLQLKSGIYGSEQVLNLQMVENVVLRIRIGRNTDPDPNPAF